MATIAPRSPTQRCQPNGLAASTATRGVPRGPSTRVALGFGLLLEAVHARHQTTRAGEPVGRQLLGRRHAQRDLRAGSDQHDGGSALGVAQHVGAALDRVVGDQRRGRGPAATAARARAPSGVRVALSAKLHASAVSLSVGRAHDIDVRALPAAPRAARSAGGSDRPRRGRSSRACRRRCWAAPSARRVAARPSCSRRRSGRSRRTARSPSGTRPLTIAPIACSRMPKCRLRPA